MSLTVEQRSQKEKEVNLKMQQQKLTNVKSREKTYGEKKNIVSQGPLRQYQTVQHTFINNWNLEGEERQDELEQILKNKANIPQIGLKPEIYR